MSGCVFCRIVAKEEPADILNESEAAIVFTPLNPVTEGHVLVVPRQHARYLWQLHAQHLAHTMFLVAETAHSQVCNVIQSNGVAATQTIPHVHFHVVPRRGGDGLVLPWTGQTDRPTPKTPEGPCD